MDDGNCSDKEQATSRMVAHTHVLQKVRLRQQAVAPANCLADKRVKLSSVTTAKDWDMFKLIVQLYV